MCNFLSAIVLRDGTLICDPEHTDSHEDLLEIHALNDGITALYQERFARIEFTPPADSAKIEDLSTWALKIDEEAKPSWFDETTIRSKCEERILRIFVRNEVKILVGGCWILVGNARAIKVIHSTIKSLHGSSQIGELHGSSQVGSLHGSSQVGKLYDSSQVGELYGSSQVGTLCGSSRVGTDKRVKK